MDMREVHARTLEYPAFFQQPGNAPAAFGPHPFVAAEDLPVHLGEAVNDRLLQPDQELLDGGDVHESGAAQCPVTSSPA
ncbi:hypothetical protein D3C83_37030 [compost metagenome]